MAATVAASLFAALDKDGDGKVSPSELMRISGMVGVVVGEEEAAAIVAAADADGDGLLDRDEFLRLAREAEEQAPPDDEDDDCRRWKCLRTAFGMYAAADEGGEAPQQCITPESLKRMLGQLVGSPTTQLMGLEECRAMICRFDLNGDGVLSFDEFRVMMHDGRLI